MKNQHQPNIGAKGQHGIYAGIARADDQGGDHILEVLAESPKPLSWPAAMKWAESVGGTLPTRKHQALLFANVPELFKQAWYWSCEQDAGDEACAWCQGFDSGGQDVYRKFHAFRARAVRRLPIE